MINTQSPVSVLLVQVYLVEDLHYTDLIEASLLIGKSKS